MSNLVGTRLAPGWKGSRTRLEGPIALQQKFTRIRLEETSHLIGNVSYLTACCSIYYNLLRVLKIFTVMLTL